MRNAIRRYASGGIFGDDGVTAMEYALIAGIVSIVIVTALLTLGTSLKSIFANLSTAI